VFCAVRVLLWGFKGVCGKIVLAPQKLGQREPLISTPFSLPRL
jgi:hypothetical protein